MFRGRRAGADLSSTGRRTAALLIALAGIGLPALILHVACVGSSCDRVGASTARVPFCSLDETLRARLVAGFRDGRSPDVLGVARDGRLLGATGQPGRAWPSTGASDVRVPIAFSGAGVDEDARIPAGTRLDAIAPTISSIIGLDRPHPEVRSGQAIEAVAGGPRPRLVAEIILEDVTSDDIEERSGELPFLAHLAERGPTTMDGDPGSLPLDPAAVLTTIGTGGLPRQHGITGRYVRGDDGAFVRAWSHRAPVSVIATLADDLDEVLKGRPKIGLVATHGSERGAIGGHWYVGVDHDDVRIGGRAVGSAEDVLARGYGDDATPDFLAVVVPGGAVAADRAASRLAAAVERAAPGGATIVVTATGRASKGPEVVHGAEMIARVNEELGAEVVEGTALGGFFVDQRVLAREEITEDDVVRAVKGLEVRPGERAFADVFPAISVSFARYC